MAAPATAAAPSKPGKGPSASLVFGVAWGPGFACALGAPFAPEALLAELLA